MKKKAKKIKKKKKKNTKKMTTTKKISNEIPRSEYVRGECTLIKSLELEIKSSFWNV